MASPGGQSYGGFWIRFLAYLVDSVVFITLLFVVAAGAAFLGESGALLITAACFVGPVLYWGVMQASSRQATFGKALLGLKVVTGDGEQISMLRSFGREIAKYASAIPLMLGFVLAAFTGRKQALHDMVASTTVVRDSPGHVLIGLLVGVFGWVAPAALVMVLGVGVLAAMMGGFAGGLMQEAMKQPQIQASAPSPAPRKAPASPPAPSAAAPKPAAAPPPATAPVAGAKDVDTVLAAQLNGFDKPGTTRAGPAVLELSTTFPSSFWIKVHVPPMDEFAGDSAVTVTLTRVADARGGELYDPKHNLESAFFQKVSLRPAATPAPHLGGTRQVTLRSGASTDSLQVVEGAAKFRIPAKPLALNFAPGDVGKAQTAHGVAVTVKAIKGKEAELSSAGDASRIVSIQGYGADGGRVRTLSRSSSGGEVKFGFEQPVTRLEVVVAEQFVERSYPFTLSKTSMAGAPIAAAPPAAAPPAAAKAAPAQPAVVPAQPAPVAAKVVESAPKAEPVAAKERRRRLPAPVQARAMDAPPAAGGAPAPEPVGLKYNDLMTAVLKGDTAAVSELLALGKWADKPDSRGVTPLTAAVYTGDAKVAELLLKAGANPEAALAAARERRNAAMTDLLEQYRK
ncbi:MAG TPA: RDD family protein [Burkholderiales bacterium]|nr:RDD family protein [Burkholderiales bacterium]